MPAAFDKWLAKPSTIRLLRELVQLESTFPTYNGNASQRRLFGSHARRLRVSRLRDVPSRGPEKMEEMASFSYTPVLGDHERGQPIVGRKAEVIKSSVNDRLSELCRTAGLRSSFNSHDLRIDNFGAGRDISLWVKMLTELQRIHGLDGVQAVWDAVLARNVDLPTVGKDAASLWNTFIQADPSMEDGKLLTSVLDYAQGLKMRKNQFYEPLGHVVVEHALRHSPVAARNWRLNLISRGLTTTDALPEFYNSLAIAPRPLSLSALPKTPTQHILDLQFARIQSENDAANMSGSDSTWQARRQTRSDSKEKVTMNTLFGDLFGIKRKEISGSFCAKIIATKSFSIDLVFQGLSFLGVDRLGPLALRELVIRASSPAELLVWLETLKGRGVVIAHCGYSRLVLHLAENPSPALWTTLVDSDLHLDVYDNMEALLALVESQLSQNSHFAAQLSVLALKLTGPWATTLAWNAIFRHHITRGSRRDMINCMQQIREKHIRLQQRTLTCLHQHVLPPRNRGKRFIKGSGDKAFDHLKFVSAAYLYALKVGGSAPLPLWREVFKRFGMDHRFDELQRVIMGILTIHGPPTYMGKTKGAKPRSEFFGRLFTKSMQAAIFTWGFRSASARDQLRPNLQSEYGCEPWAQGLFLLKELETHDVRMQTGAIKKSFKLRMWILFGPAFSKLGINRQARLVNYLSLRHYLRHADQVYHGLANWVPPELWEEQNEDDAQLLNTFFGKERSTNKKINEFADIPAWTRSLMSNPREFAYDGSSYAEQRARWLNSPIRFTHPFPSRPTTTYVPTATSGPMAAYEPAGAHQPNDEDGPCREMAYHPL